MTYSATNPTFRGQLCIDGNRLLRLILSYMSRTGAPEFRGKIGAQIGCSRPAKSTRLFLTLNLYFLFLVALAGFRPFSSIAAPTKAASFFRAAPASCVTLFELPDLKGQARTLSAENGRAVLVHFFATWCEPCKAELSSLNAFARQRLDKINVVAINVGEVPSRVRRFVKDNPVNFPVLLDEERAVSKSWAIEGLPASVVLDPTLMPRLVVTGDLDWTNPDVGAEIDRALANFTKSQQPICPREAKL